MKPWSKRESWSPPTGASAWLRAGPPAWLLALIGTALALACNSCFAMLGPRPDEPLRRPPRRTGPRTVIVALPGVSWGDLRDADMPNTHDLMAQGAVALMPVGGPSDPDPYRTWVTLGAGRAAVGVLGMGRLAPWKGAGVRTDLSALRKANRMASSGAEVAVLGEMLHFVGFATVLIGDDGGSSARALGSLVLADGQGKVDAARVGPAVRRDERGRMALDRQLVGRALRDALLHYDVALLELSEPARVQEGIALTKPGEMRPAKADALRRADEIIGDAVAALGGYHASILLLSPMAPGYRNRETRSLGPIVACQLGRPEDLGLPHEPIGDRRPWAYESWNAAGKPGLLASSSTNSSGLVTAGDFAPTVLTWWGIRPAPGLDESQTINAAYGRMTGRPLGVEPDPAALRHLDRLDRVLTDRYRLRVPAAQWYGAYGALVVVLGFALAFVRSGRLRRLAAPALVLAFVPVGLAAAAPVPPAHDALYLGAAAAASAVLAVLGARLRPESRGLAVAMLLGSAVILADVLAGSWLMRRSALDMGIMMGSRFYGIGNEYVGAVVGTLVIGLGALLQCVPRAGRLAAPMGAVAVLVIGLPFWGANWGGSITAATGLAALWLLMLPRVGCRHIVAAVLLIAAAAILPAAVDLARPAWERSHIGLAADALISGRRDDLVVIAARKVRIARNVLQTVPWSVLAAALCAILLWLLLRRGGPARVALGGQRALTAGIGAAVIAGVAAMLVNDSGPAAGFGAIAAALAATVFLAARAPEAPA